MRELPPAGERIRDIVFAINELIRGRSNAVSQVTLTPSAGSTIVSSPNFNENAEVILFPKTAAAAAELGNGTVYAAVTATGTVTITHANNATANRTFGLLVVGG